MTAREAAYTALSSYRRSGAWSDIALDAAIEKAGLDRRDASLATRICMGVLQNMLLLDWHIGRVSSMPLSKIQPQVLCSLRIGAYQLLFMDRAPSHAVVDESVKLARKYAGSRSAGFVNAILRRLSSERDALPVFDDPDPVSRLSVRYSHPEWIVREFIAQYGCELAERILAADNDIPPVSAQINTLSGSLSSVSELLSSEGVSFTAHELMPDCLLLTGAGNIRGTEAYRSGLMYIQDCAAKAAVLAAGPKPGDTVIDACAAPGGKSFAAAMLMRGEGRILSFDIHEKKLGRINAGAERLGIPVIETRAGDARIFDPSLSESADVVIADVPCSGLGVIRKKPEIRYKDEAQLASLPEIQLDILKNQSKYVKRGGVLLYSTCTLLSRENEEVALRFLSSGEGSGFAAEDFDTCFAPSSGGMLTLLPGVHGTDGFFISKFRRLR